MIHFEPPLADIGGVIWAILVFGFVIVSILRQLFNAATAARPQQPGQRPAPRPPRPARPGQPARRDNLADEIDQFLQEAQRRRDAPASARQAPPPARPQQRPLRDESSEGEVAAVLAEESVAEHVRHRMETPQFGHVASELAKGMEQTDERLEKHLHDTFDHRLGRLGGTPGETAQGGLAQQASSFADRVEPVPVALAANLAALLASPTGMRQAILLSEIINRPEDRWRRT